MFLDLLFLISDSKKSLLDSLVRINESKKLILVYLIRIKYSDKVFLDSLIRNKSQKAFLGLLSETETKKMIQVFRIKCFFVNL